LDHGKEGNAAIHTSEALEETMEEKARGIVREFFKKAGPGIGGIPRAQERACRQGASGRRTEAENDDDDGVDREGVERGGSADSLEGIMVEKGKKR
jgi:hypothetical protein